METPEPIIDSRGIGVIDGPVRRPLPLPPCSRKYTVLRVDINQEKSKVKPTQVMPFVGYEYYLDSALVKPSQRDGSIIRI